MWQDFNASERKTKSPLGMTNTNKSDGMAKVTPDSGQGSSSPAPLMAQIISILSHAVYNKHMYAIIFYSHYLIETANYKRVIYFLRT